MERDWEQCYREGNTPWDKGEAAPPLLELMDRFGPRLWGGGVVLVPGCGMGHDVRAIARAGVEVVGMDLAPSALAGAREFSREGRERYELADFLRTDAVVGGVYSAIWEHTCFCAIDPSLRDAYVRAAAHRLCEGGLFVGVFYLHPWDEGEVREGPPHGVEVDEIMTRFAPYFELLDGRPPERAYPGREGREWLAQFRRLPKEDAL